MTAERYRQIMDELVAAARGWAVATAGIEEAELVEVLRTVDRARDFGPFVDPTAWIEQAKRSGIERQRRLATVSAAYRAAVLELFPDARLLLERPAES